MTDRAQESFRRIAGPQLPNGLPPIADATIAVYREHLAYVVDQITVMNPAMIEGVQIEILDSFALNALAFSQDGSDFVGLNAGLAVLIPLIAYRLLAHPEVFPDVGDPNRETMSKPIDLPLLRIDGKFSDIAETAWPQDEPVPADPTRRHFAAYMCMVAWDFLLLHEVAHVNRCHIEYLASKSRLSNSTAAWMEFGTNRVSADEAKKRRTLEADADGVAGRILSGGPILNGLRKAELFALGHPTTASWDWPTAYKMWLRPIGLVFQLMAIIDGADSITDEDRTHPHPDIRMQLLVNSIWQRWREVIPDRAYFIDLTREASFDWREILRLGVLPSPPSRDDAYVRDFKQTVIGQWHAMEQCAAEIDRLTLSRLTAKRDLRRES